MEFRGELDTIGFDGEEVASLRFEAKSSLNPTRPRRKIFPDLLTRMGLTEEAENPWDRGKTTYLASK